MTSRQPAQARDLGKELAACRRAASLSQAQLARATAYSRSTIANVEVGRQQPPREFWQRCDSALGTGSRLASAYDQLQEAALHRRGETARWFDSQRRAVVGRDDELEALELARLATASDLGNETLDRLEAAVDDLAVRYPVTPPTQLLDRVRQHLGFVGRLMDARMKLDEHRRLLVIGGWLSLLAATLHIDLRQLVVARARLATAASLARQTEHAEMYAWCFETQAWSVLTDGHYRRALRLSQVAQRLAPSGSSAHVQATAQEGRAWARLGQRGETYDAINRVDRLVSNLPRPDRPEHHYRYDPEKSVAYTATTLAWLKDPAAEGYAREVIDRLRPAREAGGWPRRLAAARLDLALALLAAGKFDEACGQALEAIGSGQVVPSNHWRALEVVTAVEAHGLSEARQLREAYEALSR